jgi:hypothetical protein
MTAMPPRLTVISTAAKRSGEISRPNGTRRNGAGDFAVPLHYLHEPPASFRFYPPLEMAAVRNSICAISKVSGINKENRKAVKNVQSFFTAFLHHRFPSPAPVFTAFVPTAQCTRILRWPLE